MRSFMKGAAAAVILGAGTAQAEVTKTLFIETPDGAITAYFEGPMCAERVRMLFEASRTDAFAQASTPASRLMNNAVRVLSLQCPDLERVTSRGMVAGRVVYSGLAESSTKWKLTELGVRSNASIIGGATSSVEGQQAELARSPGFTAFATVAPTLNGNRYCVRADGSGTCSGETSFVTATAEGATVEARYLLDEDGAEARMSYDGVEQDGFLCAPTAQVTLDVVGGEMTDEGRADYTEMLEERLVSGGDRICTGFESGTSGISMSSFDAAGRSVGAASPLTVASGPVTLRLDEQGQAHTDRTCRRGDAGRHVTGIRTG